MCDRANEKAILKAYRKIKTQVRRWLLQLSEPCRQIVPLMSESMDRRLGIREHLKLRLHLIACVWCWRYLKQIKFLRQLLLESHNTKIHSTSSLSSEARERIAASILKN